MQMQKDAQIWIFAASVVPRAAPAVLIYFGTISTKPQESARPVGASERKGQISHGEVDFGDREHTRALAQQQTSVRERLGRRERSSPWTRHPVEARRPVAMQKGVAACGVLLIDTLHSGRSS